MQKISKLEKQTQKLRKEVALRLKKSNREVWVHLSDYQREQVVDKYLNLNSVETLGLMKILEENRNIVRNSSGVFLGVIFGLFGGISGNVAIQYLSAPAALFIVIIFFILLFYFVYELENLHSNLLGADKVLDFLVDSIDK